MTILVTGGAGFVGSTLAFAFREDYPGERVVVLDNLRRRGSELNLPRLTAANIEFVHGDVRNADDVESVGAFDLLIDCSAEPSVHAGYGGNPAYIVQTNLIGTYHCLEAARRRGALVVFLSTSRVYPVATLRTLPLMEGKTRLELPIGATGPGWSIEGIGTDFPMVGSRSLYGASKLSSEHLLEEYAAVYDMTVIVNRCGVLAGPWQMGKVDQGFLSLWAARHLFGGSLSYLGFGGLGKQVRDVLHVRDLHDLLVRQLGVAQAGVCAPHNVGGGVSNSLSLAELTAQCQERSGANLVMGSRAASDPGDIPWYVTDNRAVTAATGWRPTTSVSSILDETFDWLKHNRALLEPIFSPRG